MNEKKRLRKFAANFDHQHLCALAQAQRSERGSKRGAQGRNTVMYRWLWQSHVSCSDLEEAFQESWLG